MDDNDKYPQLLSYSSIIPIWDHCSKFTTETRMSLGTGLVVHMDFVQVHVSDDLHLYLTFKCQCLYLKSQTVDTVPRESLSVKGQIYIAKVRNMFSTQTLGFL